MSILIKGMEMPTRCEECPCFYPEYRECNAIVGRLVDGKGTPPSDCPLVPVPPHGDLIDADKLVELCDIMADKCDGIGASNWHQFKTTVEWSPIVIPAEGGE